ncbi:GvpL/GvpF family gas vesicle protein [Streptomyces rimosus]|uniref:GvpL/GvpF family gas vesicle protein n=1 Tax=Streptomyces rimosus TaxID=1927 RepID=UPI0020B78397|nr:GvpL/GvpF family gas vesicle protein [Streptomyces rimosus]UTH98340.1 Gas vesicle synthesis protein GvpL/GvpF [Streptomyces rimosus subsp. rimosus]UTJ16439.1 Gas vesicle synthesis protein GvpL/GvpF [Streptomyces rimosus subsp. rimosus]
MSTYVYGIARAGHPEPEQKILGIGDPPRPVRVVRGGDLAAIVSDCPDRLRPKRRDLLAHQHVLTEAGADGAVLPLRFGSLSESDEAVQEVLAEHSEHYKAQLDDLNGRVEYNVKAAHREEDVLRRVLAEEPEIRALNEANQASGGGAYQDKLRLGELIANAVRAREVADAHMVETALTPRAEQSRPGPECAGWLVNLSFLMRREDAAAFLEAADRLGADHPHLELLVNGPLPPYSFVRPLESAAAE